MRRGQRLLSIFLAVVFLVGVILPAYADELDEQRRQLDNMNRQIMEQRSKVNQAKKQENSIMGQIRNIETNIINTEKQITSLDSRISFLEDSIEVTSKEIKAKEKKLSAQSEVLSQRLVHIYEEGGNVSYLEVLLSATDISDFLTRYDLLNCIVSEDVKLIEKINRDRKELALKKSELEIQQRELVAAQNSCELKKDELDGQKGDKQKILSNIKQEKEACERALYELEQASLQLQEIIRRAQAGSSGEALGTGTYTWPAPGYRHITSPYGMRMHPILNQRKLHTGMDIEAPMGATIVAADAGTVIYAGWMNGYGQVIVIDHGNDMSTLYAHQSSFLVGNGAAVSQGQAIGKVGSTGWSTGPHLHFEVRVNGSPVDPSGYVR